MSDLKLKRVHIRNWMRIRQAEIAFPDKGLVLVTGDNLSSDGKMESNGAGKSSLGEAISRALTGASDRYSNLGYYSFMDKGNMYVKVEAELLGKPLVVEMGYKCKEFPQSTGERLRFTYGDNPPIEHGNVKDTRHELLATLGITPELSEWTVYIDGDRLKFNKQSERSAVKLLMSALRQPSWDKINERARKMLNNAQGDVETENTKLAWLQSERDRISASITAAQNSLAIEEDRIKREKESLKAQIQQIKQQIKGQQDQVTELQSKQSEIKSELKRLEVESAAAYANLEKQRVALISETNSLQVKRNDLVEQKAADYAEWQSQNRVYTEMAAVPKNCPTCGKEWDKAHSEEEMEKQAEKVNVSKKSYDSLVTKIQVVDKKFKDIRTQIQGVEGQIRDLSAPSRNKALSYEYENNERAITSANNTINQLQIRLASTSKTPDCSGIERYKAVIAERQDQETKVVTDVEATAAKLAEAKEVVKVVGYWTKAFGPTGIPNMVISDAIPPLNEISKRISTLMTGGTLDISYATSRQLASKQEMSSELVINVDNKIGSVRLEGCSKGESGLVNLIIAETLSEVGSVSKRIGFRWYDEVLNSKDTTVRRSILTYLKELAKQLGVLIFVVDHHPEAASYADYEIVAKKEGLGNASATTYSWKPIS